MGEKKFVQIDSHTSGMLNASRSWFLLVCRYGGGGIFSKGCVCLDEGLAHKRCARKAIEREKGSYRVPKHMPSEKTALAGLDVQLGCCLLKSRL
jgi:hypothetical protein